MKRNWSITEILVHGGPEETAIALGRWTSTGQTQGETVIGMRWNGTDENPIGNPQSRGLPTWFVLDRGPYTEAIIQALPSASRAIVRSLMPPPVEEIQADWLPKQGLGAERELSI